MKIWKDRRAAVVFAITITSMSMLLTACERNQESITFARKDDFSKKEQEFIEEYRRVLETDGIPDGAVHMDIPDNPGNSDFSIILLEEKEYGTPAFSFLPLETRSLTEEEIRQLIYAYHGADPEEILQDYSSYRGTDSEEGQIGENRPLSTEEYFKCRISLLSEYLMEGKRPENQENRDQMREGALCYVTQNHTEVWIYPNKNMTDDQILRIIDSKYADVPKDYYTPKKGQITYEAAGTRAEELVETYITDKKCSGLYLIYGSGTTGMRAVPDFWTAYVHMGGKTNDFYVQFNADNGELSEWRSYPENFYSVNGFSGEAMEQEQTDIADQKITDEQLLQAARTYIDRVLEKEKSGLEPEIYMDHHAEDQNKGIVTAKLDQKEFRIYINKADLSISQVRIDQERQ